MAMMITFSCFIHKDMELSTLTSTAGQRKSSSGISHMQPANAFCSWRKLCLGPGTLPHLVEQGALIRYAGLLLCLGSSLPFFFFLFWPQHVSYAVMLPPAHTIALCTPGGWGMGSFTCSAWQDACRPPPWL